MKNKTDIPANEFYLCQHGYTSYNKIKFIL